MSSSSLTSKLRAAVGFLIIAGVVAVAPHASAAVSNTFTLNPSPTSTGQAVTLTWTKTTSIAGDGTQQGSVVVSIAGPVTISNLQTQNYGPTAAPGTSTLTWTVYFPVPGTYTLSFVDTASQGMSTSGSATELVNPYMTEDWVASISPPQSSDNFVGLTFPGYDLGDVSGAGNIHFSDTESAGHCFTTPTCLGFGGGSNLRVDSVVAGFSPAGVQLYSDQSLAMGPYINPSSAASYTSFIGPMHPDQNGRMMRARCSDADTPNTLTGPNQIYVETAEQFMKDGVLDVTQPHLDLLGQTVSTVGCLDSSDARSTGPTSGQVYGIWHAYENSQSVVRQVLTRTDEKANTIWETVLPSTGFGWLNPVVWDGESQGLITSNQNQVGGTCGGGNFCVTAFDTLGGTLGNSMSGSSDLSPLKPVHSQVTAHVWYTNRINNGVVSKMTTSGTNTVATTATINLNAITYGDLSPSTHQNIGLAVDKTDNFVSCVALTPSGDTKTRVFAVAYTSTGTIQGYAESTIQPSASSIGLNCQGAYMDFQGGFYLVLRSWGGSFNTGPDYIEHFTAPPSSQTTPRYSQTPPSPKTQGSITVNSTTTTNPAPTSVVTTDVGSGLTGFCGALMGTSPAALFVCGLILTAVGFLGVSGAYVGVVQRKSRNARGAVPWYATTVAGSIGGVGMMVFDVYAGIWAGWVGVVLIAIVAGVVAVMVRKMQMGGAAVG